MNLLKSGEQGKCKAGLTEGFNQKVESVMQIARQWILMELKEMERNKEGLKGKRIWVGK